MNERGESPHLAGRVMAREDAEHPPVSGNYYAPRGNMPHPVSNPPLAPAAAPSAPEPSSTSRPNAKANGKPSHYKVICISMYTEDLSRLDTMVEQLKARGLTKANRSALIRYALGGVDLDRVPKGL